MPDGPDNDGFLAKAKDLRRPRANRSDTESIARICNVALAERMRFYVPDSVQHHTGTLTDLDPTMKPLRTNTRIHLTSRTGGFALLTLVILTIALIAILSAMVAMSRSNTQSSVDFAGAYASAVIMQGNTLADTFQKMEANDFLPANISYGSVTGANDMTNPSNVSLSPQVPPTAAFTATAANRCWIYKATTTPTTNGLPLLKIMGVGIDANADYAFILADLDQTVCQKINQQLTGSTTIPASTKPLSAFVGAATIAAPYDNGAGTAVDLSTVSSVSKLMQACVATNDATPAYVYYVVVEPQ
jgi:type II secretory pathway pseudopilin PulG